MKKIIAISVMLVLIAGAAFADTTVGGNVRLGATLLIDKGAGDDVKGGGFWFNDANTKVEWSGDNAGGLMKLYASNQGDKLAGWEPPFVFVWWKPVDALRIQLGQNPDSDWGHPQIAGWGFNAEAQASVALDQDSAGENGNLNGFKANLSRTNGAWWGGFNKRGAAISITPTPEFEFDVGIPFGDGPTDAATFYSNTKLNLKYVITDIGTVRLAFDLNKANKDADLDPKIYFAFYLSMIENIGIELGLSSTSKNDTNDKIAVGVGFRYSADDLGFKARLGFTPVRGKDEDGMDLGIEILPSYNLGALTVYLNAGFGTEFGLPSGATATSDFYFNPYIRVPTSSGSFYAGFKFAQAGGDPKPDGKWSLPIGWNVYF